MTSVIHLSGCGCLTLLYALMGIALGPFYSGRGAAIGPNVLWSTPFPAQESTFKVMLREFPWMLMQVILGRHMMLQVECILHYTSPENSIQTKHNMQTETQANPCIPDASQSSICQQTKIPVSPRELVWVVLVPHQNGAGQSGLPWGVLPAGLGVIIPDDPASAGTLSTDGTGVREVVFLTPAMGLSISPYSMLELMGSR